jgi:hypothetical protein
MNSFLRCPLVCVAALATYVVIHVFAGVLHHHGSANLPAPAPAADSTNLQFQTTHFLDNDEEESCLLCSVLHLAQLPPAVLHAEATTALNGEAFLALALIRPYPLETGTHSRGPPLM